jgi:hypothetical protein
VFLPYFRLKANCFLDNAPFRAFERASHCDAADMSISVLARNVDPRAHSALQLPQSWTGGSNSLHSSCSCSRCTMCRSQRIVLFKHWQLLPVAPRYKLVIKMTIGAVAVVSLRKTAWLVRMSFPAHSIGLPLLKSSRLLNPIYSCPPKAEFLLSHITLLAPNFSIS